MQCGLGKQEVKENKDAPIEKADEARTETEDSKCEKSGKRLLDIDAQNSPFTCLVDMDSIAEILGRQPEAGEQTEVEIGLDLLTDLIKKGDKKVLKSTIRKAVWKAEHEVRGLLWLHLCTHVHKADGGDIYEEFEKDLFRHYKENEEIPLPLFVDDQHLPNYSLDTDGVLTTQKIMNVIEHSNPDITYSPQLYPLVSLFLHYMAPSDCYNCIYSLLRHKDAGFIFQTKVSVEASKLVLRDLTKKYAKSAYVMLVRNCSSVENVFEGWMWWLFEDLPLTCLVRVIDCYLLEGLKVLYRVILAILKLYTKNSGKKPVSTSGSSDAGSIVNNIRQFCKEMPVKIDAVLKVGFGIRGLNRKEIHKLQVKHEMYINSRNLVGPDSGRPPSIGNIKMSRSFSGPIPLQHLPTKILTSEMLYTIWTWLPARYAVAQPQLLYTSEEHGTSLLTLYKRIEGHQPTVLVIKTTDDEIFGAFCSTYWRERNCSTKNLSYFGTGETFIFTLAPEKHKYEWVGLSQENIPNTANMFMAGDKHVLTVGGGHGEAILLDENLLHCRTEPCDTFNNQPLCAHQDFQCKVVEVYGFQ